MVKRKAKEKPWLCGTCKDLKLIQGAAYARCKRYKRFCLQFICDAERGYLRCGRCRSVGHDPLELVYADSDTVRFLIYRLDDMEATLQYVLGAAQAGLQGARAAVAGLGETEQSIRRALDPLGCGEE